MLPSFLKSDQILTRIPHFGEALTGLRMQRQQAKDTFHAHVYVKKLGQASWCQTHRLRLLGDAAAETNPELSHSEAHREAAAVSSLGSDVSRSPSSCLSLPEPQTQDRNTKADVDVPDSPSRAFEVVFQNECETLSKHTHRQTFSASSMINYSWIL